MTSTTQVIFAHANLENENQLVLKLLDEVTKNGNQMSLLSDELKTILEELANLPGPKYHKVQTSRLEGFQQEGSQHTMYPLTTYPPIHLQHTPLSTYLNPSPSSGVPEGASVPDHSSPA